jgi:hypothetical protein
VLFDREVEGDWPTLIDAPTRRMRVAFLGDPDVPDVFAGVLELAAYVGADAPAPQPPGRPGAGLFELSFFVDVEATLGRLAGLGLGGTPRRITQSGIAIATVRDPDGVWVLLTSGSITRA